MNKIAFRWLARWSLAALLVGISARAWSGEADAPTATPSLTVMTFNLRYASDTPPQAWPQRRPAMRECITKYAPDIFGTQEGVYRQLKDLAGDLPAYSWIGLGRDGGSRDEFMAVFFRTDRFEPLEYDHFWLSDTPNVIASTTWGNTNRRMVTWVKFRDRRCNQAFYFFNTHLDHKIQTAREKGASLIRQRIEGLKTDLPVFLVGDFNAEAPDNPAYKILTDGGFLSDTWYSAAERRNEKYNSFHNFEPPQQKGLRIDWILGRNLGRVRQAEVVLFNQDGQFPSDHCPVIAQLEWPPAR